MFNLGRTAVRATSLAGLFWAAKSDEKPSLATVAAAVATTCPIQITQPEQINGDVMLSRKVRF